MSRVSVSGNYVQEILAHLARQGVRNEDISRCPILDLRKLRTPFMRFSPVVVGSFLDYWANELDQRLLGLEFGLGLPQSGFGLLGAAVETAETVADALSAWLRLVPVHSTVFKVAAETDGNSLRLLWKEVDPPLTPRYVEAAISSSISRMRAIVPFPLPLQRITFAHERRHGGASDYEASFGCPVLFSGGMNAVTLPRELLGTRLRLANGDLHSKLVQLFDDEGSSGQSEREATAQLVCQVAAALRSGDANVIATAGRLRLTGRTMQRRFQQKSMTFSSTVDAIRANEAIASLMRGGTTISAIAQGLDFSEHATLTRAFRRWTGLSPSRFRETLVGPARP